VATSNPVLPVIPLPGLRLEVLGNYLASLGLLRLLARKWPGVRIAWRDGVLQVVGGPQNLDELLEVLVSVAQNREWTPYKRQWKEDQQEATKQKAGRPLAIWRAEADEESIELFDAHDVALDRVAFNPLLGTGGNAGKRDFARGWSRVVDELQSPPAEIDLRQELRAWLLGKVICWMIPGAAAASWFSSANKLYNSGQSPFREEPLSPWAMALACEGLPFFAGSASRRLGARARAQAAFPFVCQAASPTTAGEAGRDRGEIWAPVWDRPMTLPEVRALFQRGRAEVRGRGANTPAAFAAAIVRRGVDAGLCGFVRYALGATTSAKTFEPRHEGLIPVPVPAAVRASVYQARSTTVERILDLIEHLPKDLKKGQRWLFVGLRGPIEEALIRFAQTPPEDPFAFCELLDAVVSALDRVDRNVGYREKRVQWEPLPLEMLQSIFASAAPDLEARLAMALVSAFPALRPFALYRFGVVVNRSGRFEHPKNPPAQWVYRAGQLPGILTDVLLRSVLDWEKNSTSDTRHSGTYFRQDPLTVSAADLDSWFAGDVDESLLARWLGRLALFDWKRVPDRLRGLWRLESNRENWPDGPVLLVGLFQPLFDSRPLVLPSEPERGDVLPEETGARTPGAARAMAALIRTGRLNAATAMAKSRYAMANVPLMRTNVDWQVSEPERLLAALLFPLSESDRSTLIQRWLRPVRIKKEIGGYAYV